MQASNALTGALGRLFAVAEAYPDLKAADNFKLFQEQLEGIENKIAYARQFYNSSVLQYNNMITTIPGVWFAGGRGKHEFLEARFGARTTSLCGQNAVQVVVPSDAELSFEELAQRFQEIGQVSYNEFMLRFAVDGHEIVLFPDGRAIVKGTNDESVAKGLYAKYVGM